MSELENNIKRLMGELGMTYEKARQAAEMNARMAEHSCLNNDDSEAFIQHCQGRCIGGNCHD